MIRTVGNISYNIERKRVKNINMRVKPDGGIYVSANRYVPVKDIDAFVLSKAEWIDRARQKAKKRVMPVVDIDDDKCREYFEEISDSIYPIFRQLIKKKPEIVVKELKSAWGICHYKQNYIVLNKSLVLKPRAAVEYVVMHEYVHFLEPNHQKGFHDMMQRLMPDYKERKKLLK